MLDKFWGSITTDLAKRWMDYIFGPAFLFWMSGLGLYIWRTGWQEKLAQIQSSTPFQQGIWIFVGLLVLIFSSALLQALRFPILRLLEGYWFWPLNYLGQGIIALRTRSFQKNYNELRRLKNLESEGELDAKQRERITQLDIWAHWNPSKENDLLPTNLGNILRSRERSPERKFGLDAVVSWPRLWPLLPSNVRDDLTNSRASLDYLVELWFWGLLFLLWASWTPWVIPVSLLWMIIAYTMALQAAMTYGDLLEAAFDLYRLALYDAIKWPRPANLEEEKVAGKQLTEFLWRGTLPVKTE